MEIIKIDCLIGLKKTNVCCLSALYFKELFRLNPFRQILIPTIRAVLINAIIKTVKTLALTVERLSPFFRIASSLSLCKFSQLLN